MNKPESQSERLHYWRGPRPTGIRVLIGANACAALILLWLFPQYSGGRSILYLCAGLLHTVLAFGLFRRQNWARFVTIIYALLQSVGMALWSLIKLLTLMAEPLSRDTAGFLLLSAVVVPFLVWTTVYLLRQATTESELEIP